MRANLIAARKGAGLTQSQVAAKIGVGLRMYQRMESGTREGRGVWWDRLETLFGKPQSVLRENTTITVAD